MNSAWLAILFSCQRFGPSGADAEVVVQAGASSAVTGVAWSPDGSLLASAAYDGGVQIVDAATFAVRAEIGEPRWGIARAAWSPDGTRFAVAREDDRVRIVEAASGRLARAVGPKEPAGFAWSGSRLAVASRDGRMRTADARWLRVEDAGDVAAFSADGLRVAWSRRGWGVSLYDAKTGAPRGSIAGAQGGVTAIAWRSDARAIALGSGAGVVQVWDLERRGLALSKHAHTERVRDVAWSADGTLASSSDDGTVLVWQGDRPRAIAIPGGAVYSVAWSPDAKRLATGGEDGALRVFDAATGREERSLIRSGDVLRTAAWSPDGRVLAVAGEDGRIRLFDPRAHSMRVVGATRDVVWSVAWSPDGRTLASGGEDALVRLWDPSSAREKAELSGHSDAVYAVAWSPNGRRLVSGSRDDVVVVWDAATGRGVAAMAGESGDAYSVAWGARGIVAGFQDGTVRSWDGDSFAPIAVEARHSRLVRAVALGPDGRIASASFDGTVRAGAASWIATAERLGVAWTAGGRSVVSVGADGVVRIREADGTGERTFPGDPLGDTAVAPSPDGTTLAVTGNGGRIRLVRIADGATTLVRPIGDGRVVLRAGAAFIGGAALARYREAGDLRCARLLPVTRAPPTAWRRR